MMKNLRPLILTLGILITTGISSAVYAQDCTTPNYKVLNTQDCNIGNCAVNPGQSLQDICAKYGIDSKCLTAAGCLGGNLQVTNPCNTTPCDSAPTITNLCK